MLRRYGVCMLLAMESLLGCGEDGIKMEIVSPKLMATEGTSKIRINNACGGHKYGASCNQATVVEVESLVVDDPSVAGVTRLPPTDDSPLIWFDLKALNPGKTTLRARAKFSDGSTLEASRPLSVATPDALTVEFVCGPTSNAPQLVQQGWSIGFTVQVLSDGQLLDGSIPALVEAEGVTESPLGQLHTFEFTAPLRDAQIPLESRFVDEVGVVLESFGPERITSASVEPPDRKVPFRKGQLFSIVGQARVGDRIPCHAGPLLVTTETPSVCAGPQGEQSWEAEWYERFPATAMASGTCRLLLSPVGGALESEVAIHLNVE